MKAPVILQGGAAGEGVFEDQFWKGSLQSLVSRVRLASKFRKYPSPTKQEASKIRLLPGAVLSEPYLTIHSLIRHIQVPASTRYTTRTASFGSAPKSVSSGRCWVSGAAGHQLN